MPRRKHNFRIVQLAKARGAKQVDLQAVQTPEDEVDRDLPCEQEPSSSAVTGRVEVRVLRRLLFFNLFFFFLLTRSRV